jgi:hypothetical protein
MGFKRDGEGFYDFSYGVYLTQRNAEEHRGGEGVF